MELAKRHLSHLSQMLEFGQHKSNETESISKSTVTRRNESYIR